MDSVFSFFLYIIILPPFAINLFLPWCFILPEKLSNVRSDLSSILL